MRRNKYGKRNKLIAGILENMQEKMDMLLTGYLKEQRQFEKEDLEMME